MDDGLGQLDGGQPVIGGTARDGAAAVEAGIASYCVAAPETLEDRLAAVLVEIAKCEPGAVAQVKRLVLSCATAGDEAVMDDASESLVALLRRPEALEGMAAFHEKRPPAWAC